MTEPVQQFRIRAPRVFEAKFFIGATEPPPPRIDDWPPLLFDTVMEAMEQCMENSGVKELNITRFSARPTSILNTYECVMELTEVLSDKDVIVTYGNA